MVQHRSNIVVARVTGMNVTAEKKHCSNKSNRNECDSIESL